MKDSHAIGRITTLIAMTITLLCAVIVPLGYYFLSYQHMAGVLDAEAQLAADRISREISRLPQMWKYETARLHELLLHSSAGTHESTLFVLDDRGDTVIRAGDQDARSPCIVRSAPLRDAGELAGRVEVRSSLRWLLVRTGFVAVAGLIIGVAVLNILRRVPLRAVYLAEEALRKSLEDLEKNVIERTAQLSEANMRLIEEIDARKRAEKRLLHETLHDALTGLSNRTLLNDRLEHAIAIAKRNAGYFFAVLFLDIDRFKFINDTLGHLAGDQLLVSFGQRLTSSVRPGDTLARLGGDEFVVLLEDTGDEAAVRSTVVRIQEKLRKPFSLPRNEVLATASIGVAMGAAAYDRPDEIMRDADTAMYQAKLNGRDTSVVFEPGMHDRALKRQHLEADLRRAVAGNEFIVYYQPIYVLRTNDLIGYEALVRWNHPERGVLGPDEFIPVAEDAGIMACIDRIVLREACRQLRQWQRNFTETPLAFVSVNISGKHLVQHDLIEDIAQVLDETELEPESLQLEFTEQMITQDPDGAAAMLARLKAMRVQLCIDDFGTGYSSLSCLHRLPIDGLKIDRSFVQSMELRQENQKIVKSILMLAQDMNIDAVAEGVETAGQLERIVALRCMYGQGYLFSEPLRQDQATALLRTTHPLKAAG